MAIKTSLVKHFSSPVLNLSIFLLFILLIFTALGESLHLSLWGDDWFMFYIIDKIFGPGRPFGYLSLKGYFEPMGVMNLTLMINRYFFGYSSFGYYLSSMALRLMGSFISYIFLFKFSKSRLAALIGSLFVLVGYTGIETTNYPVHTNTYLVPLFLFLTLIFLIDSYKGKLWKFLLGFLFFILSLIASPLRSHGILPFIIVFDLMFSLIVKKANIKHILLRQTLFVVGFFIVRKLGFFGKVSLNFINTSVISEMIKIGDFTFISSFISTLGNSFFPDVYARGDSTILLRLFGVNWYLWLVAFGFLIASFLFWFIAKITQQKTKNYYPVFFILTLGFCFLLYIFDKHYTGLERFSYLISSLIGVFFLTFSFWAIYISFTSESKKNIIGWVGIAVGPIIVITSTIVPLLFTPGRILESNHRYLTLSLVGVAIATTSILKLVMDNNKKIAYFIILFFLLLITLNIKADRRYFASLYSTRNPEISNFIWDQFYKFMPQNYPENFLLFYFDDSENAPLASAAFLYGFPSRLGLKYKIPPARDLPAMTTIYDEVISTVTDGKAFRRLGYPEEKIEIDQVFAFKIGENGELTDITQKTRVDLAKHIQK